MRRKIPDRGSTLIGMVGITLRKNAALVAVMVAAVRPLPVRAQNAELATERFAVVNTSVFGELFNATLSRADRQATPTPAQEPRPENEPSPPTAQKQEPPPPEHGTGLRGLVKETGKDFVSFTRRRSTWLILGAGGAAAALSHLEDDYVKDHVVGSDAVGRFFSAGKWIGSAWVQTGASVGVYVVGRYLLPHAAGAPTTNKTAHVGFDLIRAQIVSQALVHGIKYTVRRDRPTGECCAFPSGHAATAFAAASVLERHFGGYRGAWPTMLVASYVAASRLHDNKHFLSDVVFGSAIGIATGWTVVGRHGRTDFAVVPVPVRGGMAVTLIRRTD